jgi:hypothetical protein
VFIRLKHSLPKDELKAVAAHEFMHASPWAYSVAALGSWKYEWLKESTAQWAIDGVYGNTLNFEHREADHYLASPDRSLEAAESGTHRFYGSYLFFPIPGADLAPRDDR